jgi:hypothetical protein
LDRSIHTTVTLFAALSLLDIASTHLALQVGLPEANHLPSMLLAAGGEPAMYLFKALVSLLVIAIVLWLGPGFRRLRYGLQVANAILAATVVLNTVQVLLV